MTSILSGILSVIVSIAMAFGGVGELPSTPETATQITIGNLDIVVNGEEVSSDAAVTLTGAVGADEWLGQIGVSLGGEELASVALKLTETQLSAALAGSDNAYTVGEAAVEALTGIDMDDLNAQLEDQSTNEVFTLIGQTWTDVCALIDYCKDMDNARDMQQQSFAVLFKNAETRDVTVDVDGAEIPAVQYDMDVTMDTVYDLYDWMETCGIEPVQNYVKDVLSIISLSAGQEFTSVREALQTMSTEELSFSLPLECVIAQTDDLTYEKVVFSNNSDGIVAFNMTGESKVRADGSMDFNASVTSNSTDDDSILVEMNVTGNAAAADGELTSLELSADLNQHYYDVYNYDFDEDETETDESSEETATAEEDDDEVVVYSTATTSDSVNTMHFSAVKGEGGWDVSGDLAIDSAYSYQDLTTGEEPSVSSQAVQVSGSIVNTKEADGSTTAKVTFESNTDMGEGDESKSEGSVSFTVNTAVLPYTDPTADKANTVELTADMAEIPEGMNDDLAILMNAAAKISQDENIARIAELFSSAETVYDEMEEYTDEVGEDAADGVQDDDFVSLEEMTDWSEIASYLTNEAPAVTLPENCSYAYGFASKDGSYIDVTIVDANGDMLYDVSVSQYDFDPSEYIEENAVTAEIEGRTAVFETDDDGVLIDAEVYDGNNLIFIYFYNVVDQAEAEQIIADLL